MIWKKASTDEMTPEEIAQLGELSMLLELSSSPKPGNVDRCHDYSDLSFQQFLLSAVSARQVLEKAACGRTGTGDLILESVTSWRCWGLQGNTHFGSMILLIPLAQAAGRPGELEEELDLILKSTTAEDSVNFYRAFDLAGARVAEVEKFSLKDPQSLEEIRRQGRSLLDLMILSQGHDLVAREWSTGYSRIFELADRLGKNVSTLGLNHGVVRTFLEALAEVPDSLVQAKFGPEKAMEVLILARETLKKGTLEAAREMDSVLIMDDINPGSTADLIAASIFVALLRGAKGLIERCNI
jgi:triphosphoribosyl-dephospho-CoA synthase